MEDRVKVLLRLDKEEKERLQKEANELGITLNAYITLILKTFKGFQAI